MIKIACDKLKYSVNEIVAIRFPIQNTVTSNVFKTKLLDSNETLQQDSQPLNQNIFALNF